MSDEVVFYDGRIPTRVFLFQHNLLWLLLLGWNIGLIASYFHSFRWHVRITSQRLVLTRGFVARKDEEVEFFRVKDTSFEQSFLQRLAGVGTLTIISEDATAPELTMPIHDPSGFREKIRDGVRVERQRMGTKQIE
ncbi:MAG TPA: PH domain-containing protein [Candidatus Ozemobacteraceae bacterium]|nr:PH domain-containing protein [Candidatus Ozemobacteraceae bacterium]